MGKKDYYEILGVTKGASDDEIKKAYRKKAMEFHPDRNPGNKQAEENFKEAAEAYNILSDPQKREAYNKFGHNAFQQGGGSSGGSSGFGGFGGFGGFDMNDIFSQFGDIFGDFSGNSRGRRKQSSGEDGSDLRYDITISLKEAYLGTKLDISFIAPVLCDECNGTGAEKGSKRETCPHCKGTGYTRQQRGPFIMEGECPYCKGTGEVIKNPCHKCRGSGKVDKKRNLEVKIPAGISDGQKIRINGEGEVGTRGGRNGDLYVFVNIKKDDFWTREENNLYCKIPIIMTKAVLGGQVELKLIDDESYTLKIPAGTKGNTKFKVSGKGMPILNSGGRKGDLYVNIEIETPTADSQEEKDIYLKLDEILKNKTKSNGFFDKWFK
jgi:molecular chaperone DnaJ